MLRKVEPITLGCEVRVEGDHIAVTGLFLHDAELEKPSIDRVVTALVQPVLKACSSHVQSYVIKSRSSPFPTAHA
jgi:hypothetical protein